MAASRFAGLRSPNHACTARLASASRSRRMAAPKDVAGSLGVGVDGHVGLGGERPAATTHRLAASGGTVERGVDPGDGEGKARNVVDRGLVRLPWCPRRGPIGPHDDP
jgi:hypothetical protein